MSGLQDTLSKLCCCFDIEFGGFLLGVYRVVHNLARVMIAIILLWGGITEGVEPTEAPGAGTDDGGAAGVSTPAAAFGATYDSDRKLTKVEMIVMGDLLLKLAICWAVYYAAYFLISFIYLIGLKMNKWVLIVPMLIFSAADIVASPFLPEPTNAGILFAYMMDDFYIQPQVTLMIVWESACAIFGLYTCAVVWGSLLVIKNKYETPRNSGASTKGIKSPKFEKPASQATTTTNVPKK